MDNKLNKEIFTHSERMMHQSWCLKNDIKIYFQPKDYLTGRIVIEECGRKLVYPELYKQQIGKKKLKPEDKKWWVEVLKLYTSRYLENN